MLYFQCSYLLISILITFIVFTKVINSFAQIDITDNLYYDVINQNIWFIIFASLSWTMFFLSLQVKPSYNEQQNIIWNDDTESIPSDNSLITLEFTKNGVMYVGPYNPDAKHD
jgi:uncharacterized membrane protein